MKTPSSNRWGFLFPKVFISYMKIIITESQYEMLRNRASRRVDFMKQYVEDLNSDDVCTYWKRSEIEEYVNSSMADICEKVCHEIGSYDLYDEIYEYLVNNDYQSQIREFFIDTYNNYCSK